MISRRYLAGALLIEFVSGFAGCRAAIREVNGDEACRNIVSDPLDCTVYRGDDRHYYYFERHRFKSTDSFKVAKDEVDLPSSIRVGDIPHGMRTRRAMTRPS